MFLVPSKFKRLILVEEAQVLHKNVMSSVSCALSGIIKTQQNQTQVVK